MKVSLSEITDYKLKAIGKVYVSYTHNSPSRDTTLFMEKVVEILEEFTEEIIAYVETVIIEMRDSTKRSD